MTLPDQSERDVIANDLDTTILVEAAAGTGKTTSMVGRMVRLLAEGKCTVATLAAVTFTRKATAELRDRFRMGLERGVADADGERRDRLDDALNHVEQCFIGTIHSFCARILRERPIEAKIDVAFDELDEDEEYRLRSAAWKEHIAELHAEDAPLLAQLDTLGVGTADLSSAFMNFAEYPDVDEWPVPSDDFDDALAEEARRELRAYAAHMETMAPGLPWDAGNDTLMPFFRDFPRRLRNTRLGENRRLIEVLEDVAGLSVVQKNWPGGPSQGKAERDRLRDFVARYATPLVQQWQKRRYGTILDLLHGAILRYNGVRAKNRGLSYQDLLMKAAALLRDKPHIREYFRKRFTHLLVDEFQDTDPIQAEVMMFMTAANSDEQDWRACRPSPGALFVVGDPKQAIYRFRRADIVTYNEVRNIIEYYGRVVRLTTNFRSAPTLIKWFNEVSATLFPAKRTEYSPADSPMQSPGDREHEGDGSDVTVLAVPDGLKRDEVNQFEADAIARLIRDFVDRGVHKPSDFLVLTRVRGPLVEYARRLQEYGLPVEVTGGAAVNELSEVALLHTVLAAVVEPDNPVALVGALRSELFGVSDTELYRFKKEGGTFNIYSSGGHDGADGFAAIDQAKQRLKLYAGWLAQLQPIAAVERIAGHLGLFARAALGADGRDRAGGLCKAIELLRAASREYWTAADLVRHLWNLVDPDLQVRERHDGASLIPHAEEAVRVMNLHQAKGLEAPVVFLVDGTGRLPGNVDLCLERGADVDRRTVDKRRADVASGAGVDRRAGGDRRAGDRRSSEDRRADVKCWAGVERRVRGIRRACVKRRARVVRGYLQLRKENKGTWGRGRLLAEPEDWETKEREERSFQDAEEDRLLYVAATRAATQLVISSPAKQPRWEKLLARVPGKNVRGLPEVAPPVRETMTLPDDAVREFAGDLAERWAARCAPTYEVMQVKTLTVTGSKAAAHPGEHGTEWGTVLHLLLEAAMNGPAGDLLPLAKSAMQEHGLDPAEAMAAVKLVRSVTQSDLWKRARKRKPCMAEVPIQFRQDTAVPTIVRGVIDLVFREPAGWVIVDYKTDDRESEAVEHLVEHYEGQVRLYAEAWSGITGEPVVETGLYFVRTDRYRVVAES